MKRVEYILICDGYEVCRRFKVTVGPLSDYMVKRVGDELKKIPARVRLGKRDYSHASRRIFRLFHSLRFKRRKANYLKIEYHEHARAV